MGNSAKSGLPKGVKDITNKTLGKKLLPLFERIPDMNTALAIVNPNYRGTESDPYSTNCALCTTAGALQLMGYDVEAMPRDATWRGFSDVFDYEWIPENFKSPADTLMNYAGIPWDKNYANTNRFYDNYTDVSLSYDIESQMQTWGTNSFAAMNVAWKDGGAHVVIVYRENNQTTVMDFQTHERQPLLSWLLNHTNLQTNSVGLYRLDNQKIKSNITDLNKIVKKRGK